METNLNYDMYVPTRVLFGAGMLNKLGEQPMPGKKALIIISNGKSTRANGYLERTEQQLRLAGIESVLFDGVSPNPTVANVEAGAEAARAAGCDFVGLCGCWFRQGTTYSEYATAYCRHYDNGRYGFRNRQRRSYH